MKTLLTPADTDLRLRMALRRWLTAEAVPIEHAERQANGLYPALVVRDAMAALITQVTRSQAPNLATELRAVLEEEGR